MTRKTGYALASAWLRSTSWRERATMAIVALIMLGALATVWLQGYNIGAHVWRQGWLCGQITYSGNPFCMRDPNGGM